MSFVLSAPLQQAVYAALRDDAALAELVGAAIFDAAPAGVLPPVYVQLGDEIRRVGKWSDTLVQHRRSERRSRICGRQTRCGSRQ